MNTKLMEYLKEIKENRGSYYLKQLHKTVTYDNKLTTEEALYLQRFIELELYIMDQEVEANLNEAISIMFN